MVFSGGGDTTDNDGMKPLHNFDLPCLKWGNQKVLRCMNVDRKMKSVASEDGGDTTVRFREKLMIDFQTEVGKMKDAILRGGGGYPSPAPVSHIPATAMMTSSSPVSDRPWNLRTRRGAVTGNEITKPVRNDVIIGGGGGDVSVTTSGEKREREKEKERAKFSISISRREIEEDFAVMSGRRLPHFVSGIMVVGDNR
ncbi:hypothetical protein Tco_0211389 [Tanacetum coccineum]